MFTPCLNECLHHVWKHIYTMYETCLHNILRHVYTIMKKMLAQYWKIVPCLKISLHSIWRHVYRMFQAYLHYVGRNVHTTLEDILSQNWWHFHKCLKPFVQNGVFCWKWMKIKKKIVSKLLKIKIATECFQIFLIKEI